MKRILCLLLVLLVIPVSSAFAAKTERVEAFGFYGLYVKRMMEYQTIYEDKFDFRVEGLNFPMSFAGEIEVQTVAGTLTIGADDFKINQAMFTISDPTYKDNTSELISACAAISALEFSESKENIMKLEYQAGLGGAPSAIQKMMEIFTTEFPEKMRYLISKKSSEKILTYSGNYDYYLDYYTSPSTSVGNVYLIAEAK